MNNPSKKHHFIPQFILKNWADDKDDKIQYYKMENNKLISSRIAPKSTGYEENLYPFNTEETVMQSIDSDAAPVVHKMISQCFDKLNQSEREFFLRFVICQYQRNPVQVSGNNQLGEKIINELVNNDPIEIEKMRKNYPTEQLGYIASIPLLFNEKIMQYILGWKHKILDFKEVNSHLIISNIPYFHMTATNSDTILVLPLSPKHVFLMVQDIEPINEILAMNKKILLKRMNVLSAQQATKYIYAFDDSHRKLIEKYFKPK